MRTNHCPNLDAEAPTALMEFWAKQQNGRHALALFPEGGRGTMVATRDLANYASNKATAMLCRERGDIERATYYESICDRIYAQLADDFKSW